MFFSSQPIRSQVRGPLYKFNLFLDVQEYSGVSISSISTKSKKLHLDCCYLIFGLLCVRVCCPNLQEVEALEHVGHFLCISSLIEEIELERHVSFSFFYQPHERKVWKEPMNHLQEKLHTRTHTHIYILIYFIQFWYFQKRVCNHQ